MILVVADTSPLNYLVQIGCEELLPALYDRILVPGAVIEELTHSSTPAAVRDWLASEPKWLEVREIQEPHSPALAGLGAGEAEAIQLAQQEHADLLLMDERRGASLAQRQGLEVTGTPGRAFASGPQTVGRSRRRPAAIAEHGFSIYPTTVGAGPPRLRRIFMSEVMTLTPSSTSQFPALLVADSKTRKRVRDFFTAHIRNPNTRRAYRNAALRFSDWCQAHGIGELGQVETIHVSAYIEEFSQSHSRPTVKQHLAALKMLFDWLVLGQVIPANPASVVRGPSHSQKKGKTPVLTVEEARELLDSIETDTLIGLRDRALIALLVYSFSRVGAAVKMRVEDYYTQGRRGWVRLHEKGGKQHEMPAHHNLDSYLEAYVSAADIAADRKGPLFRTMKGRTGQLTRNPLLQQDVHRMIRQRAAAAGIKTQIGCHTFRATGITAYLKNGGKLEVAQQMAAHESSRTTGLYDRRSDEVSLDEVERIAI